MTDDNVNKIIASDSSVNRPLSMPAIAPEEYNSETIADKKSAPEMNRLNSDTTTTPLMSIQNQITNRLLRIPRQTIPLFGLDLFRHQNLNFKPYLNAVAPGSEDSDGDNDNSSTTALTGTINQTSSQTKADRYLNRLQIASVAGSYQFDRMIQLPYMRKNLSLAYAQTSVLRNLTSVTVTMAKMLEVKLEAIKLNSAAADAKKTSLTEKLMDKAREIALFKSYEYISDKAGPFLKEHFHGPIGESVDKFFKGEKSAPEVVDDVRTSVKNTYTKLREKISGTEEKAKKLKFKRPSAAATDAEPVKEDTTVDNETIANKTPGIESKYQTTTPIVTTAKNKLKESLAAAPLRIMLYRDMINDHLKHIQANGLANPNTVIDQPMLPDSVFSPDSKISVGEASNATEDKFIPNLHPIGVHPTNKEPNSVAGKSGCLDCCVDLIHKLDNIYNLLATNFGKQEKASAALLGVLEHTEHDEAGPRIGSYQDHLRKLKDKLTNQANQEKQPWSNRFGNAVGGTATAVAGGLGGMLPGGSGLIHNLLYGIFGPAAGWIIGTLGKKALGLGFKASKYVAKKGFSLTKNMISAGIKHFLPNAVAGVGEEGIESVVKKPTVLGRVGKSLLTVGKYAWELGKKYGSKALGVGIPEAAASTSKPIIKYISEDILKAIGKKIPLLGTVIGTGLAVNDLRKGNYIDAAADFSSGLAANIPGYGTSAAIAIDATNAARHIALDRMAANKREAEAKIEAARPDVAKSTILPPMPMSPYITGSGVNPTKQVPITQPPPAFGLSIDPTNASETLRTLLHPPSSRPRVTGKNYVVSGTSALYIMKTRLKAYGFPPDTDLNDVSVIRAISQIENLYLTTVTNKSSVTGITDEEFGDIAYAIGLDGSDKTARHYIKNWYQFRFTPVYMAYLKSLTVAGATPDDVSCLTPSQVRTVISAMLTAGKKTAIEAAAYVPTAEGYQNYSTPDNVNSQTNRTPTSTPIVSEANQDTTNIQLANNSVTSPSQPNQLPTPSNPLGGGYTQATQNFPTLVTSGNDSAPTANMAQFNDYTGSGSGVLSQSGGNIDPPVSKNIGSLSARFESSKAGSAAIGYDGTGGTSYGTYQISSNSGTFAEFLKWAAAKGGSAAQVAQTLEMAGNPNGGTDGPVAEAWKKLAAQGLIKPLESEFIKKTQYDVAFNQLAKPLQAKIDSSKALQEVLFSTAVQNGPSGAAEIFNKVGNAKDTDETMIRKIYQERSTHFGSSTPNVRAAVFARLGEESRDALQLAEAEQPSKMAAASTIGQNGVGVPTGTPTSTGAMQSSASNNTTASNDNTATANTATSSNITAPTNVASTQNTTIDTTTKSATTPNNMPTTASSIYTPTAPTNTLLPNNTTLPAITNNTTTSAVTSTDDTADVPHINQNKSILFSHTSEKANDAILNTLTNIYTAMSNVHTALTNGHLMDDTNALLQKHLDKPTNIIAPVVNNTSKSSGVSLGNDLNFSKAVQNAGAAA